MPTTLEAHAIDITKCTECAFVGAHGPEQKIAQCKHPLRMAIEQLEVFVEAPPPKHCPHRDKVTVLRVVVPAPAGLRVVR